MKPNVLLVEDDPTTSAYLSALVSGLPAQVHTAAGMAQALDIARAHIFDLWLFDARLPDGSGIELLHALRHRGMHAPAIAHTATHERSEHALMIEAGFEAVLCKPVDVPTWTAAIRGALGLQVADARNTGYSTPLETLAVWDDEAAARALGGHMGNVAALRELFLAELPGQLRAINEDGAQAMHEQLHRLRASCALVGAARLDACLRVLQASPASTAALHRFQHAARQTLAQRPPSAD